MSMEILTPEVSNKFFDDLPYPYEHIVYNG